MQLRKDETGYVVIAASRAEIPQSEGTNSDVGNFNMVAAIRKCLKSAHIRSKYAVTGLCGPDIVIRSFSYSSLNKEDINQAVIKEAEQVCPFEINQYIVDYQIIYESTQFVSDEHEQDAEEEKISLGILAAATDEIVVQTRHLIKDAALRCVYMDVNGLALLNCLMQQERIPAGQAIAILDIGSSFTNLAVMRHNGLPFIRDIPHAGNDIINRFANENNLSPDLVNDILFNPNDTNQSSQETYTIMHNCCARLLTEISQTLRYYMAQESTRIGRIYVCGGFAQAKGLIELIESQLPAQVQLWNPFVKIRCQAGMPGLEIIKNNGAALAVAAGLAMRTI